jgi:hypothetical protein
METKLQSQAISTQARDWLKSYFDTLYSITSHSHTGVYSPVGHDHNSVYSLLGHNHDTAYAPKGETCTAYHNTTQTIATGTGWTALALNADLNDALGWHDPVTNNSRIYPVGANGAREYQVIVQSVFFASNATGFRGVQIADGSGNTWNQGSYNAVNGDVTAVPLVAQRLLNAGDYIVVQVRQTSGISLAVSAFCKVTVNRIT